ncbi:MAG: methyltransferase [Rikenellaceae bacterium]|jgi:tRNA1Val (adenine37-N6)-methyltransferase|nr:methyltransferase [Rikenellaceae bacterium]
MNDLVFRFKQFAIEQSADAGMKVGTDGVLLGAWCALGEAQTRLLDVGTGTGVIALMLAQRAPWAAVDALDIDPACCARAAANVAASPWPERVKVINAPVQEYAAARLDAPYDHIVSNPPYFTESLLPPSPGRTSARHTVALTHSELFEAAATLLAPGGRLSVILPAEPAAAMAAAAPAHGFRLVRFTELYPRRGGTHKRTLQEFVKFHCACPVPPPWRETLAIHEAESNEFTDDYKALTKDFYLKF